MASLRVVAAHERTFGVNEDIADVLNACHWLLGTSSGASCLDKDARVVIAIIQRVYSVL